MTISYACRGVMKEGRCKTFVATSHVFGGSIGVVLLEHGRGDWAAYASSDTSVNAEMILKIVSDRWIIEEHFHDRQRDLGRRSAASSQPVFEHRLLALVRLALRDGRTGMLERLFRATAGIGYMTRDRVAAIPLKCSRTSFSKDSV